jgi:hypothetical protein
VFNLLIGRYLQGVGGEGLLALTGDVIADIQFLYTNFTNKFHAHQAFFSCPEMAMVLHAKLDCMKKSIL